MRTLDHLYSRHLKSVKISKDGTWRLMLEGDAQICNHDSALRQPDIPKDMYDKLHFAVMIMDEEHTQLVFKNDDYTQEWRVILNPSMYSIKIGKEEESFPQRGQSLSAPVVQAHPDERVADGPTGDEEEEE